MKFTKKVIIDFIINIYIPVWIDLKLHFQALQCRCCHNLHSSMDRFEANKVKQKEVKYVNLHSSMDRFEVTSAQKQRKFKRYLHSSMDRFEVKTAPQLTGKE